MVLCGDARKLPLRDQSVQCVVTSPPYWGLRNYGLPPLVWDDPGGCEHEWGELIRGSSQSGSLEGSTLAGTPPGIERRPKWSSAFCLHCPAWRGSLGLEPTPDLHVAHLVDIFREVRRVLRDDGTVWLNLGDSYAGSLKGSAPNHPGYGGPKQRTNAGSIGLLPAKNLPGLKSKDLVGIPWRVAFALQADGWYLRSDIVWAKPNPMPESVRDRPTRSHEYLFLLSKNQRYYYDSGAIKEPSTRQSGLAANFARTTKDHVIPGQSVAQHRLNRVATEDSGSRNRRSVWFLPTQPYRGAHFATFPEKLVEPCILAGVPLGGVVLDPFVGSGTTVIVAQRLGRVGIGVDLKLDYLRLAQGRLATHVAKA